MRVLIVGGHGREHALAWRLAQDPSVSALFVSPGNPGAAAIATCLPVGLDDLDSLVAAAQAVTADLVVIGPEGPLVAGLADRLRDVGIACFGPSAAAARLEGSKRFMKEIAARAGIPTARFGAFTDADAARAFLDELSPPYVIKADGLAAGKGVSLLANRWEADAEIVSMLSGKFGAQSAQIVIEEFLAGEELSLFALCDGKTARLLGAAQDHKRAFDGDQGPNTGGMGAYAPAPVATAALQAQAMRMIVQPALDAMAAQGAPFTGVLFAGLMATPSGPKLIEFNCRFGDPECQTLMPLIEGDLAQVLYHCATGTLDEAPALTLRAGASLCVVLAAQGYPDRPTTGGAIAGLAQAAVDDKVQVFHAGTKMDAGVLRACGGRVLNICAQGADLAEARARAYAAIDLIHWPDGFYRRDIGWRALTPRVDAIS